MIYPPSEDSYLLEKQVRIYSKDKSFLDLGSGSGIQAEAALDSGAKSVIATDIDKDSLKNLKNKFKNSKKVRIIKSDLFSNINKKFDLIAFNPPYLPEDEREPIDSRNATTGGKKGDEILLRFIKDAPKHLNEKGIILLLVSSLTPKKRIKSMIKKIGFRARIISKEKLFMEQLEVWEISKPKLYSK